MCLYAIFDLNHDKVAAFVGDCDSIAEFVNKTSALKSQTDHYALEQNLYRLKQLKDDWVTQTKQIATEELNKK